MIPRHEQSSIASSYTSAEWVQVPQASISSPSLVALFQVLSRIDQSLYACLSCACARPCVSTRLPHEQTHAQYALHALRQHQAGWRESACWPGPGRSGPPPPARVFAAPSIQLSRSAQNISQFCRSSVPQTVNKAKVARSRGLSTATAQRISCFQLEDPWMRERKAGSGRNKSGSISRKRQRLLSCIHIKCLLGYPYPRYSVS